MSDFTDRIKELEEEIAKKKEEVHRLKYGELEDAYAEFITARDTAMEKFNAYKDIALAHGRRAITSRTYFL